MPETFLDENHQRVQLGRRSVRQCDVRLRPGQMARGATYAMSAPSVGCGASCRGSNGQYACDRPRQEAQHPVRPHGQPRLRRTGRVRRRNILRGAPTPRIDELAAEGTRLTNFNVEAQCTPSRSAIMTGRFSIRSGTQSVPIGGEFDGLTRWEVTIAEALSAAGYATGAFGKWHLGSVQERLPNNRGFDEWYGIPRTTDEAFWPDSPQAKAAGAPPMHVMEGRRRGGRPRRRSLRPRAAPPDR
jgi:hypothetical protein